MSETEASISDLLLAAGFSHERTHASLATGKHRIFHVISGNTIGEMTAAEAVDFLENGDARHDTLSGADRATVSTA